jgi:hypothetical protein
MPLIVGVIFALLSVFLLVLPAPKGVPMVWYSKGELLRVGIISLSFALYISLMKWLGYMVGTWLLLAVVSKYISNRRISGILIWTGAVAVGTYFIFRKYLHVPLPVGFIGEFIRQFFGLTF